MIEAIPDVPPNLGAADGLPQMAAGGGDSGKQTRAQKKVMKAMSKLNLKHVPGIMKVVMRNGKKGNILFSIHGGEVYKVLRNDLA